ncbi:TfuA domain-containing protein, partial [Vibrio parahaemolyticus]|uniref:TfuA domain-containing protein n=1 Tax=Vibrio parahaemolyticus TaxID=670 RepID=UPI0011EC546B
MDKEKFIFVGPSNPSVACLNSYKGFTVLPPAQRGDILSVISPKTSSIALIDGYWGQNPSVVHKEILEAISYGIDVRGSSSMGALRAAELNSYGMAGIGSIFEWYKNGTIEGDDEVALLHLPKELNYKPISIPLVNIRATLNNSSFVSNATKEFFLDLISELPIRDRTLDVFTKEINRSCLKNNDKIILTNHVLKKVIDQKQIDSEILIDSFYLRLNTNKSTLSY